MLRAQAFFCPLLIHFEAATADWPGNLTVAEVEYPQLPQCVIADSIKCGVVTFQVECLLRSQN
jgi:hypothetical protein